MATRKIRLTLSGTQLGSTGPIIDIDFDGTNLEADYEVTDIFGTSTVVKEYTVDKDAGTFDLDIEYKNDEENGSEDRNLYIERIEYANDGTNYEDFDITESNSNLTKDVTFTTAAYEPQLDSTWDSTQPRGPGNYRYLSNPDFDSTADRTDIEDVESTKSYIGNNPQALYSKTAYATATLFESSTATFNVTFS